MEPRWIALTILLSIGSLSACQGSPQGADLPPDLVPCPEVRGEICPMNYDPVCGYTAAGKRVEASNRCSACSDEQVVGTRPGKCPA